MLPVVLGRGAPGPLRILCLGAHSDDIEIGCGASVLHLLEHRPGSTVRWVVFSAEGAREAEARASAADFLARAGEAQVVTKTFQESFFPAHWSIIKGFFEEVRRAGEADVVFTHYHQDLHQDHRVVSELTWNTFRNHLVFEYEIPKYEGDLGRPNVFLPVSRGVADRKVELLMRHFQTQAARAWFRPDTFHGLMSIRGVECHAPEGRAEAFHGRKLVF